MRRWCQAYVLTRGAAARAEAPSPQLSRRCHANAGPLYAPTSAPVLSVRAGPGHTTRGLGLALGLYADVGIYTCFTPASHLLSDAHAAFFYASRGRRSGVYHWAMDNYGGPKTPVFGGQIEAFQVRPYQRICYCEGRI